MFYFIINMGYIEVSVQCICGYIPRKTNNGSNNFILESYFVYMNILSAAPKALDHISKLVSVLFCILTACFL